MGGNNVAGFGVSDKGGNDVLYIFAPCKTTSIRGLNLNRSNSRLDNDLEAFLNLEEALQMNQQYSLSHVQKDLGRNGHSKHFLDHVPTFVSLRQATS
jgi:hypothetical protein